MGFEKLDAIQGKGKEWNHYISPKTLSLYLRKTLKECDLPPMTWYQATQHTFVSQWVMNGGSMVKLAHILGHSEPETTKGYAHLAPTRLVMSPLETILSNPRPLRPKKVQAKFLNDIR